MAITPMQQRIVFLVAAYGWVISTLDTSLLWSCLPAMATCFQVSDAHIHSSIYSAFLGMFLSCLFFGHLSDLYGRKPIFLYTSIGFFLVTVLCAVTKNFTVFLVGRFFQGALAAAPYALGGALMYDIYDQKKATIQLGYLTAIYGLSVAVGGPIGAAINSLFGWHVNFWILAGFSGVYAVFLFFFLPETRQLAEKKGWSLKEFFRDQYTLLSNEQIFFVTFSRSVVLEILTLFFAWIPLIYTNRLGVSSEMVSWGIFAIAGAMFFIRFSAGWVMNTFTPEKTVFFSLCGGSVGLMCLTFISLFSPESFWFTISAILVYATFICAGIPGFNYLIFDVYPKRSGSVGAVITFVRLFVGALLLRIGSFFYDGRGLTLSFYVSSLFLGAFLLYMAFFLKKRGP